MNLIAAARRNKGGQNGVCLSVCWSFTNTYGLVKQNNAYSSLNGALRDAKWRLYLRTYKRTIQLRDLHKIMTASREQDVLNRDYVRWYVYTQRCFRGCTPVMRNGREQMLATASGSSLICVRLREREFVCLGRRGCWWYDDARLRAERKWETLATPRSQIVENTRRKKNELEAKQKNGGKRTTCTTGRGPKKQNKDRKNKMRRRKAQWKTKDTSQWVSRAIARVCGSSLLVYLDPGFAPNDTKKYFKYV